MKSEVSIQQIECLAKPKPKQDITITSRDLENCIISQEEHLPISNIQRVANQSAFLVAWDNYRHRSPWDGFTVQ